LRHGGGLLSQRRGYFLRDELSQRLNIHVYSCRVLTQC